MGFLVFPLLPARLVWVQNIDTAQAEQTSAHYLCDNAAFCDPLNNNI